MITTGRQSIEIPVQQRAQEILNIYNVGVTITQIIILNALPPKRVQFAFDEVNKAAQDMLINDEYMNAPEITEDRIYHDTMENVFKKYTDYYHGSADKRDNAYFRGLLC